MPQEVAPIFDPHSTVEERRRRRGSIVRYEQANHPGLLDWIIERTPHSASSDPISILDFSEDGGIFSVLLAKRFRQLGIAVDKVIATVRGPIGVSADPEEVEFVQFNMDSEERKVFDEKFIELGRYDLIILKEMLYEVSEYYEAFFEALRNHCLKNDDSHLIVMSLAKEYAPVPVPSNALLQWRNLAVSKSKVYAALIQAGFNNTLYGASVEVKVPKADWANILKSGSMDAVKFASGCDVFAIDQFINSKKGKTFEFEEKMLVIFAWIRKPGEPPTYMIR